MNQINFISNPPYNKFAFEQESGTRKGVLTFSGINTYTLESVNTISGVKESNSSFIAFDFKNKDITIGNDKHSLRIEKDRADSKYSFLQFNEDKPVKVQFGTSFTDGQGNNFIDDFNLTYKTGYLNLDKRPYVNGIAVLLSGEDGGGGGNIIDISGVVFTTGNQTISGAKTFANGLIIRTEGEILSIQSGSISRATYFNPVFNKDYDINLASFPYLNSYISFGLETGRIGESINSQNSQRELKIWETGGFYGGILNKIARFGANGIILAEDAGNRIGIGTVFPQEKVHISGGNLRVEDGTGIFSAIDLNNIDNFSISGVDVTIQNAIVDLGNSQLINAVPQFVNETTNFIISGNDNGRIIFANSATQITGTIVSGNVIGFNTSIIQVGNGQIQITGLGDGVAISSFNNQFKTAGRFATISLIHTGNNRYLMYGNTI